MSLERVLHVVVLLALTIDVVRDVLDLSSSLINSSVQLHGILCGMLQCLSEVGNLTGKLTLRRSVLSILFLYLGQVLELDSLTLKDSSLHLFDHFFLLLAKLVVSKLHSMDFFSHGNDLSLTDCRVKSILHFFFELDFTLPKKNLLLSFNNLSENVSLFLLELSNLVLKLDRLVFELFKLLLELILNVEVIVFELFLLCSIVIEVVIKSVHLAGKVLEVNVESNNLFLVALNLIIESKFLLFKNRFFSLELIALGRDISISILLLNQISLVLDPLFLYLSDFFLELLDLLINVASLGFKRTRIFIITILG